MAVDDVRASEPVEPEDEDLEMAGGGLTGAERADEGAAAVGAIKDVLCATGRWGVCCGLAFWALFARSA